MILTDRPCRAAELGAAHDIHTVVHERQFGADFDRDTWTAEVSQLLDDAGIELVVMAGFGTIFGAPIYETYANRILNTHPALLPAFPGWHAVEEALSHGVKVTGCTIHVAELVVDSGPILAQEAVDVLPDDTVSTLHERIKAVERRLYVATVRAILARGTILEGRP